MEETKKLDIPEGYEFDRVENGEVILKKAEAVLPKTWNEIKPLLGGMDCIVAIIPSGMANGIRALFDLICARDAWWKQLGWKPDWKENSEKHCIGCNKHVAVEAKSIFANYILAFPTEEVRDQFLEAFKDLIEEAKELL